MRKDLIRFFALLSGTMVITGWVNRHDVALVSIDSGIAIVCLTFAVITARVKQLPLTVRK